MLPDNDWDVVPEWGRAADVILEVQHRHLYEPSLLRPGGADLHVRYNRHGYVRTLAVQHQAHYSRFVEGPS